MDIFLIVWLVVGVLAIFCSLFMVGYDKNMPVSEKEDAIFPVVMVAMTWPFLLGLAILISPFAGIYYLGKYLGNRQ